MARELLVERLGDEGFAVDSANDGEQGWDMLNASPTAYSVLRLDRQMPRLNGLDLLRRIKQQERLQAIPAIFQTGSGERAEIREGIEAGCYYYLVKPIDLDILVAIVKAAISDNERHASFRAEVRRGIRGLSSLRRGTFEFRTIAEANDLGTLLAYACPDPETQVVGLSELLINAVEHGNLGISYKEKSDLLASNTWQEEVDRRLALEEFKNRRVRVEFERPDDEVRITIRDEGSGFDWMSYLEIDPRRAFDTHGRGIAMAKMFSFSRLEYRGNGSEVVACVECASEADGAGASQQG
jgi:CheY-like chemotaxis protein/anti-sigma regulatory factor (Ser/Thr protein kinase)